MPVSHRLVSVALKSCQSKICFRLHMSIKSLNTIKSELTLRPLLTAVWTFLYHHVLCDDSSGPSPQSMPILAKMRFLSKLPLCFKQVLFQTFFFFFCTDKRIKSSRHALLHAFVIKLTLRVISPPPRHGGESP